MFDSESVLINAKIEDLDLNALGKPIDAAIVSIPCTGASIAGRTKNKLKSAEQHEGVGHLFHYTLNWLAKVNTPLIMFECVPQYTNTASMEVIRSVLCDDGYTLVETVQNGQDFGAIENRSRMIAIAFSNELLGCFGGFADEIKSYYSEVKQCVGDILEDIEVNSARWKPFTYLIEKEKRDIENGKGFRRAIALRNSSKVPVIGFDYAKCRSNEPFVLLDEAEYEGLSRIFTSKEHAALKTIPNRIIAGLSETVAHQVLTNLVYIQRYVVYLNGWVANYAVNLYKKERSPLKGKRSLCDLFDYELVRGANVERSKRVKFDRKRVNHESKSNNNIWLSNGFL